jgi:hydrogenase maturation protease
VSPGVLDRFAAASKVADAVLYEGYVLYPYRASAQKNQLRWQFGVLAPPAFCALDPSERAWVRTDCVLLPGSDPVIHVRVRCLQLQRRSVEVARAAEAGHDVCFVHSGGLDVDGSTYTDWDEAVEHIVDVAALRYASLAGSGYQEDFLLAGGYEEEIVRSADGTVAGRIIRSRRPLTGRIRVCAGPAGVEEFALVRVEVENTTAPLEPLEHRDEALAHALVAVHTMLAVDDGAFASLLDPPAAAANLVAQCQNDGTFPVLIGSDDAILSSPIILYDHPQVAAESLGDLYDATEIDEILALRILTLTEAEKAEARQTDPRAAAIIERCDAMAPDAWERLHGEMRALGGEPGMAAHASLDGQSETAPTFGSEESAVAAWCDPAADASVDPWCDSVTIAGVIVTKGTAVRLRPSHRADAQDLFLAGRNATVAGVFTDVDGASHIAVTVDDDPANEELAWQGRYLFFHPDEVEPVIAGVGSDPDPPPAKAVPRVLIAGIGNVLLSDDGFGVEVAARLAGTTFAPGVRVDDFGIKGVHLAYELLDGFDALVLIDALDMGELPGTLAVIEADASAAGEGDAGLDAHSMSPDVVLATLSRLGGHIERVYVLGCQPADLGEGMGLSSAVAAAVDAAVTMCGELAHEIVESIALDAASLDVREGARP